MNAALFQYLATLPVEPEVLERCFMAMHEPGANQHEAASRMLLAQIARFKRAIPAWLATVISAASVSVQPDTYASLAVIRFSHGASLQDALRWADKTVHKLGL